MTKEQHDTLGRGELISFTFRHPSFARWDGMDKSQLAGALVGFRRLQADITETDPARRVVDVAMQQIRVLLEEQDKP